MISSFLLAVALLTPATPAAPATEAPAAQAATHPTTTTTPHRTFTEAKRVHEAALVKARERFMQAHLAAEKAYLADLDRAANVAMRAGNLQAANDAANARKDVKRVVERLEDRLKQPASPLPVGTWDVWYTNGATDTCRITADGTWEKLTPAGKSQREPQLGHARVADNGDVLLTYHDGPVEKAERLLLTTDGQLVIEHYNPATTLDAGRPFSLGIAQPHP
jgi:hypothetical protein